MVANLSFSLLNQIDPNLPLIEFFRVVAVFLIIGILIYQHNKIKQEDRVRFLILFVEVLIGISFISLLIFWDPNWATIFLTMGLLIVTLGYTISNQMNVSQIKNERISRIYKDMALRIYSPIHFIMKETNEALFSGYILVKFINNQSMPIDERMRIINSPDELLNKQVHDPDRILKKYLIGIKQICRDYEEKSKELDILLEKIERKRQAIWPQFETYCRSLKKDPLNFQGGDLEATFGLIIANPDKKLRRYMNYQFYEDNKRLLFEKLQEWSLMDEITEYNHLKNEFITLQERYDPIMHKLLIDWQKEYDLIESDVMGRPIGF